MATIQDVAALARVSKMTVSRVVNGTASVKEETRKRVEQAMRELNYVPSLVARSLSSGQTQMVGLIVANLTSPFFLNLANGAEDVAHASNYRLILCNHDDNLAREREYIEALIAARVDGMIITPASDESKTNLAMVREHGIPFVLVDRIVEPIKADYVIGDSASAAHELVDYLLDCGHRRIAIINGPADVYTARERLRGYQLALAKRNIEIVPDYIRSVPYSQHSPLESHYETVRRHLRELLHSSVPPTAVFAVNHAITVHVLQALRELGDESQRVAVVCFEDIDPWNLFRPLVTAAIQPAFEFGKEGMQLLLQRMKNPDAPYKAVVFQPKLRFGQIAPPV